MPARVYGYHRALRVWSFHHRGTKERPGLVLGLDRGGSCQGCVFEVSACDKLEVAEYLWAREMVTAVYSPRLVEAHTPDGPISTLAFVLDRAHAQYAGTLSDIEAAHHIRGAHGLSGPNVEYVRETVRGLERIGVHDEGLASIIRHLDGAAVWT